jgi:hypothetical protein
MHHSDHSRYTFLLSSSTLNCGLLLTLTTCSHCVLQQLLCATLLLLLNPTQVAGRVLRYWTWYCSLSCKMLAKNDTMLLYIICAVCKQAADIILYHLISSSSSNKKSRSSNSNSNCNSNGNGNSRAQPGALQFKPTADDPFADDFLNGSFLPTALSVSRSSSKAVRYSSGSVGSDTDTAQLWVHKKLLNTTSATSGTKTVQDVELYVNNAR